MSPSPLSSTPSNVLPLLKLSPLVLSLLFYLFFHSPWDLGVRLFGDVSFRSYFPTISCSLHFWPGVAVCKGLPLLQRRFVVEVRAVLTCMCRDKHFKCSQKLHWFRKKAVVGSHLRSATSLAPRQLASLVPDMIYSCWVSLTFAETAVGNGMSPTIAPLGKSFHTILAVPHQCHNWGYW